MSPLRNLEQWDEFVQQRYDPGKNTDEFRNYENAAPGIREFYRLNHLHQTRDFVLEKKRQFGPRNRMKMGIWEALEYLNTLVDDSDPDTDLSQIDHNLQAAQAIRRDGHPDWFQLVGLTHDLGKVLCLWGEPQWAVVGDTFPTGCAYSQKIVFSELFAGNPDAKNPEYQTPLGIYERNGGLDKVDMSWGHDEYFYQVAKDYLPDPALYMIRYHSFYAAHREGAYDYLMSDRDREMFGWVKAFNPYDLYSKSEERPSAGELRPYYQGLIDRYFPKQVAF
ncbi:MAG TPA: inositol oxygenase family protein [Bryobacteraceae bacterium]|nr:inositol oxygenase family protein [Bryobacteraceae bacterium]